MEVDASMCEPILIQGAHLPEVRRLVESLHGAVLEEEVHGFQFWVGRLKSQASGEEHPVVISLTGIGMALAAASVMAAVQRYSPRAIINQGIAGGHTRDVQVGDIIIGEYCINMNNFKTPFGPRGSGSDSLSWMPKRSRGNGGGHEEIPGSSDTAYLERRRLLADPNLLNICRKMSQFDAKHKVVFGGVGTSETWNSEIDRIDYLNSLFGTVCEEMEAAAAAQIAALCGVPFISIRIISNNIMNDGIYNVSVVEKCQDFVLKFCNDVFEMRSAAE